jgi:glycerol-3-phosphate acyltransferase PlsY
MLSALAIVAAHLIGALPCAYLIVRWRKGIDIRTVGSGNVGATNAGRLLGFRYFLLVFALDFAKGFLPTWGLPRLVHAWGGAVEPWLPVAVAVAAILGHNFPIYLGFRGGKGVATSLGAISALDPIACAAAVAGFAVCLLATRMVSASSIVGALALVGTHFARTDRPWSRENLALSVALLGLLTMLIIRHRKNFLRIAAGTEPRVPLRPGRRNLESTERREGAAG